MLSLEPSCVTGKPSSIDALCWREMLPKVHSKLKLLNDFLPFFFSLFSVLLTGQQRCRPRQVRRRCGGCRRCWQPVRRQPRLLRRSFAPLCIYMNLHPTRTHPLVPPHLPLSLVPPHAHTLAQWQTTLPERQSSHSVYCTECK